MLLFRSVSLAHNLFVGEGLYRLYAQIGCKSEGFLRIAM